MPGPVDLARLRSARVGMLSKNCFDDEHGKGRRDRGDRQPDQRVAPPRLYTNRYSGMMWVIMGSIMLDRISIKITSRPGNLKHASSYAASDETSSMPTMVALT